MAFFKADNKNNSNENNSDSNNSNTELLTDAHNHRTHIEYLLFTQAPTFLQPPSYLTSCCYFWDVANFRQFCCPPNRIEIVDPPEQTEKKRKETKKRKKKVCIFFMPRDPCRVTTPTHPICLAIIITKQVGE